jgi:hypothetical protein
MRRLYAFTLALFFLAVPSALAASFGVSMNGSNEVPLGDTNGVGFADLILEGTTLRYAVVVYNVDRPTAMHVHPGRRGETGPPIIPLPEPFVRLEGCPGLGAPLCGERWATLGTVELDVETADDLVINPAVFYLNVHNEAHPSGAVRGQVQFARYLPVVGRTRGAAQTNWFTRLAAVNPSVSSTSEWSVEIIPQSPYGSTSRFTSEQTPIGPLHLSVVTDFNVNDLDGIGAARILSDQDLAVTAAIYNGSAGERGDFGYNVHGLALENARTSGVLMDLANSSASDFAARMGHRTNIGFFNPEIYPVEAIFRAFDSDGTTLGQTVISIPAWSMVQVPVFELFDDVPESARVSDSFWVRWQTGHPIFVYATVVNNATGDPEFRD